jgi:hypothetical protein
VPRRTDLVRHSRIFLRPFCEAVGALAANWGLLPPPEPDRERFTLLNQDLMDLPQNAEGTRKIFHPEKINRKTSGRRVPLGKNALLVLGK